jgi:hypothetical protein
MLKRKFKITKEDIEHANESLMNMTEQEINELENSSEYIHFTNEEINNAWNIAIKKYYRREKFRKMWKRLFNIFN